MVRPWRSRRRRSGAPSAAGRRPSGSAGAVSARPGARSPRRRCPGWSGPGIRAAGYGGGAGGAGRLGGGPVSTAAMPIGQVDAAHASARPTGLDELDRVLGGGLVPGAVLLLAGEPGVGKSTLLLEAGALVAASGPVLYITGEESAAQVRLRADRIGAVHENLYLAAETDLDAIITHVRDGAAEAADHRLGADDRGGRRRRRARRRDPGPRGRGGADRGGQGAGRCRPSWSGTSPRTARWRARAPWSTWSTWCCTSRATGTHGCGWSARSRTGTARRTRSAASTSASTA